MKLLESNSEKLIRRAKTIYKALKTGSHSIKIKGTEVELVRYELPNPHKIYVREYSEEERKGTQNEDFVIFSVNGNQVKYYSEYTKYDPSEDVFKYPYKSSVEVYISKRFEKFGVRIRWEHLDVINP